MRRASELTGLSLDEGRYCIQSLAPAWRDLWLTVLPIWAVLSLSRVAFYAIERLRHPDIIPPVTADAIQGLLLVPVIVAACYLTLRAWRGAGLLCAVIVLLATTTVVGVLARPAYALASLISPNDASRVWLDSFYSHAPGAWYGWLSNAVEYGVLYLCCAAAALGLLSYRSFMDERLLRALMEASAAQERLRALRTQLNPHFLFNALNNIASLSDTHASSSQQSIAHLSELLRQTLRASEQEEHGLSQELAYIESYLRIQQVRQPLRIDWRLCVDDDAASALVPSLILLPLIENAVTHGLRGGVRGVEIDIEARRQQDNLLLRVKNTCGKCTPIDDPRGAGLGLRNVRERLHLLFGARAALTACRTRPDFFEARITLPLLPRTERSVNRELACEP